MKMKRHNPLHFHTVSNLFRSYFSALGYKEVHMQTRARIIDACEDPFTISKYSFAGEEFPLMQTGQMGLDEVLLESPSDLPGVFCVTTSYRDEPNPVPNRHDLRFALLEFEGRGKMNNLIDVENGLLRHMGFNPITLTDRFPEINYEDACKMYNTNDIEHEHEEMMYRDFGDITLLKNFPVKTSPFWNMKLSDDGKTSEKIDVICGGQEMIGSGVRSKDPEEMTHQFYTISDGKYAEKLFDLFGRRRVLHDIFDNYVNKYYFFDRFGGGMGDSRARRGMMRGGLIPYLKPNITIDNVSQNIFLL